MNSPFRERLRKEYAAAYRKRLWEKIVIAVSILICVFVPLLVILYVIGKI